MTQPRDDDVKFAGARTAYEFALWSLSDQVTSIHATDAKSERAFTLAVALAGLTAAVVTFELRGGDQSAYMVAAAFAVALLLTFLASAWCFFRAYSHAEWRLGPTSDYLLGLAAAQPRARFEHWLAEKIMDDVEANAPLLALKTMWSTRLFRVVVLETVLAGSAMLAVGITAAID